MICVDINGGLGNQLFQYATAFSLANRNNDELKIDISHFDLDYQKFSKTTIRNFQLCYFNITAKVCRYKPLCNSFVFTKGIERLRRIRLVGHIYNAKFLKDKNSYEYDQKILESKGNIYLCGYFQSWKYFYNVKTKLLKELSINSAYLSDNAKTLAKQCSQIDSVSIHIRRGDYLTVPGWLIDGNYYIEAVNSIKNRLNKKLQYYVFCDDLTYAKSLFSKYDDVIYISEQGDFSDLEEFYIMQNCSHHIISNSSYSWWAAFLGEIEESIIIAPLYKQWDENYYPPKWLTIRAESSREPNEF